MSVLHRVSSLFFLYPFALCAALIAYLDLIIKSFPQAEYCQECEYLTFFVRFARLYCFSLLDLLFSKSERPRVLYTQKRRLLWLLKTETYL